MSTVTINSIIRKLYVEHNGAMVEVKQIANPEDYDKKVTIYTKEAAKGDAKGTSLYAVAVEDFVPKKRAAVDSLLTQFEKGVLSAEQVVAAMQEKAAAKEAKKAAKA